MAQQGQAGSGGEADVARADDSDATCEHPSSSNDREAALLSVGVPLTWHIVSFDEDGIPWSSDDSLAGTRRESGRMQGYGATPTGTSRAPPGAPRAPARDTGIRASGF
jgi:hypothetical protein